MSASDDPMDSWDAVKLALADGDLDRAEDGCLETLSRIRESKQEEDNADDQ